MRRWRPVLLALAVCLLAAACAQDDSDRDPHGGFYGGVSGGMMHP